MRKHKIVYMEKNHRNSQFIHLGKVIWTALQLKHPIVGGVNICALTKIHSVHLVLKASYIGFHCKCITVQ